MSIVKAVSAEAEVEGQNRRSKEKAQLIEVIEIRRAIVRLFDGAPGCGFTSKEILERVNDQGYNLSLRQINPKMKMVGNVFYRDEKKVWQRRICGVCQKPLQLDDTLGIMSNFYGHDVCLQFLNTFVNAYKDISNKQAAAYEQTVHDLELGADQAANAIKVLELEVERLTKEVKRLTPTPLPDRQGSRRIVL